MHCIRLILLVAVVVVVVYSSSASNYSCYHCSIISSNNAIVWKMHREVKYTINYLLVHRCRNHGGWRGYSPHWDHSKPSCTHIVAQYIGVGTMGAGGAIAPPIFFIL